MISRIQANHRLRKYYLINSTNIYVGKKSVVIPGINDLRIFLVMITDWETNFTDLQANDFGNLGKNDSGNILVGNHAVIFTAINSPRFFSFGNVCVDNGRAALRCSHWHYPPSLILHN